MSIRNWHYGKLIIIWAWVALIIGLLLQRLQRLVSASDATTMSKFAVIALMAVLLIVATVITWKWLTGKQNNQSG